MTLPCRDIAVYFWCRISALGPAYITSVFSFTTENTIKWFLKVNPQRFPHKLIEFADFSQFFVLLIHSAIKYLIYTIKWLFKIAALRCKVLLSEWTGQVNFSDLTTWLFWRQLLRMYTCAKTAYWKLIVYGFSDSEHTFQQKCGQCIDTLYFAHFTSLCRKPFEALTDI